MSLVAYSNYFKQELEIVATYRNGSRAVYANALEPFAAKLSARIRAKKQNVVLITGATGSGKSTIALDLCYLLDPKFNLQENYIYSVKDLKKKLKNPNSCPISLFDEGSVSLNSGNSMKKDDKMMVVLFDTMRSFGWTSIICIPDAKSLNRRVRENHVNYLILCPNSAPISGYDPRGFCTIYEHVRRDWGKDYWKPRATTLFPKMKPRIEKEYLAIKKQHQLALINDFVNDDDDEL